ncbi:alginate lyase family protein [Hymenobacter cellulosilyticus]|uniref:Alginate lyase family protein n=1 Tax=Hymenobacter cellulosilyticus TaxID=2932248 RepID=A0A8T9Q9A0_9BACT|nr:alginate lyase family protein [Hymenobacter cellulosilyticus]UOQ74126.1 alginate lyase family protein [Hymenobacter cellulosilyticus]
MKYPSFRAGLAQLGLALAFAVASGCQEKEAAAPDTAEAAADSTITTFRHPGVVNSKASLDLVAAQANAGDATRTAGYNKVVDYMNQYAVPTSFPSVVYVVGSGGSPTEDQIRRDAILAYACALRWVKTGNATYANQAKQILNGYAYNFQRYSTSPKPDGSPTEFRQTYLEAAWVAPTFVAAGEIIRYYQVNGTGAAWSATDVSKFSDFLNNLKNNYVNNVPGAINDINNWQASYAYAKMALGVWFNSTAVYDSGYDYLFQILPQLFYSDGAVKEQRDRDCIHPQYTLTALTYAAETARIQGNAAIYEANGQQIKNGWNKYEDAAAGNYTRNCSGTQIFPGIETAYNYYGTSKLASLRDRQDPYGVPGDKTFLGFTSFTHRSIGR